MIADITENHEENLLRIIKTATGSDGQDERLNHNKMTYSSTEPCLTDSRINSTILCGQLTLMMWFKYDN